MSTPDDVYNTVMRRLSSGPTAGGRSQLRRYLLPRLTNRPRRSWTSGVDQAPVTIDLARHVPDGASWSDLDRSGAVVEEEAPSRGRTGQGDQRQLPGGRTSIALPDRRGQLRRRDTSHQVLQHLSDPVAGAGAR
jgi:hypothetical protein